MGLAMEVKDVTYFGSKARPIFIERDYDAAKRLLSLHAQTLKPFLEAGRFQSLIRELSDYERRSGSHDRCIGGAGSRLRGRGPPEAAATPVVRRRPLGRRPALLRLAAARPARRQSARHFDLPRLRRAAAVPSVAGPREQILRSGASPWSEDRGKLHLSNPAGLDRSLPTGNNIKPLVASKIALQPGLKLALALHLRDCSGIGARVSDRFRRLARQRQPFRSTDPRRAEVRGQSRRCFWYR